MSYWVTFHDRPSGCIDIMGIPAAARRVAREVTGAEPHEVVSIPYPASPILHRGPGRDCPPYCWVPVECAGLGFCPHSRACND